MANGDIVSIEILDSASERQAPSQSYLQAYQVWFETWQEEYSAIDQDFKLSSDNFTRQDYVLSIKLNGECAAITYFHEVDLSLDIWRKDSYFAVWPKHVIEQICQKSSSVLVCSAFTVAKKFRKQRISEVSIADLLAAASIQYYKQTDFKLMVGNMRNSRGANHVVYKFGAELLQTIDCKSELSDLVLFEARKLPKFPNAVQNIIAQAWMHEQTQNSGAIAA